MRSSVGCCVPCNVECIRSLRALPLVILVLLFGQASYGQLHKGDPTHKESRELVEGIGDPDAQLTNSNIGMGIVGAGLLASQARTEAPVQRTNITPSRRSRNKTYRRYEGESPLSRRIEKKKRAINQEAARLAEEDLARLSRARKRTVIKAGAPAVVATAALVLANGIAKGGQAKKGEAVVTQELPTGDRKAQAPVIANPAVAFGVYLAKKWNGRPTPQYTSPAATSTQ